MASATSAAVTGYSCKSSVRHACIPGWWTVHRAAMNPGRAGYSPTGPAPPPYTVNLLCADHELDRKAIRRTRLPARTEPGRLAQRGPAGVRTGVVRPGDADGRRRPPFAGDGGRGPLGGPAATTARRRTPHRHACPLRHACPRRILARPTAPTIRSGIDFHSTAHGRVPVGPHSVAACGRLVPTAPPGSPVPVGRFCAAPVAAPPPHCGLMKSGGAPGRPPPHARRSPHTPANGSDCAGQRPRGWLQGSEVSVVRSGPWGLSADSATGVDGLRSR